MPVERGTGLEDNHVTNMIPLPSMDPYLCAYRTYLTQQQQHGY